VRMPWLRRWTFRYLEVNDIVREKRLISPEMVVLLPAYFGTSDGHWINLQAHFDLEMAKEKVGKQAVRIRPHPHGADGSLLPVLVYRRNHIDVYGKSTEPRRART
jgi:hypothetical protein